MNVSAFQWYQIINTWNKIWFSHSGWPFHEIAPEMDFKKSESSDHFFKIEALSQLIKFNTTAPYKNQSEKS